MFDPKLTNFWFVKKIVIMIFFTYKIVKKVIQYIIKLSNRLFKHTFYKTVENFNN